MTGAVPLLQVHDLAKHHRTAQGTIHAVDGVSFSIATGEVLGLVGESGCGKSTLGRTVVGLEKPSSGQVAFEGADMSKAGRRARKELRRQVQIVFQDPYGSLNPRKTVSQILSEPFSVHGIGTRAERRLAVAALLERVGLRQAQADLFPHEFSGGQRQRISIARAIALKPKLIVCDEAVSALDVSIQAQILNLLRELQRAFGLSYLFISHDLAVMGHIAHRVAVMYLGQIVEIGRAAEVCSRPHHPYTQALFAAAPSVSGQRRRSASRIHGEAPSPFDPPSGCRFHTRCPTATDLCRREVPLLRRVSPQIEAACHFA